MPHFGVTLLLVVPLVASLVEGEKRHYDPNVCRSAWVSYIKDDFEVVTAWESNFHDIFTWSAGLHHNATSRLVEEVITQTLTTTETFWKPAPTPKQCDGFLRVLSAGETTITQLKPVTISQKFIANIPEPSSLPSPMYGPQKPVPVCEIEPDDCREQWDLVQKDFDNWSVKVSEVNILPDHTDPTCIFTGELAVMCSPSDVLNKTLTFNDYLDFRQFPHDRGFMGGCHQWEEFCGLGAQVIEQTHEYHQWDRDCIVNADRFVLVYFHSPANTSRDLCANEGYGDDVVVMSENPTVPQVATLDHIVFPRREVREGVTLLESTMTGKWTMTSPSVYLAYDTIAADGYCVHPGKKFKDGVITLHLTDLSSVVRTSESGCSYTTIVDWEGKPRRDFTCANYGTPITRQFNLADLNGPVPASAYFQGQLMHDSSIIENQYYYEIAMPAQVSELEPVWTSCHPFNGKPAAKPKIQGVWDPPIVLYPTNVEEDEPLMTLPIVGGLATKTVAVPGSVVANPGPTPTGKSRPAPNDPDSPNLPLVGPGDFHGFQDPAIDPLPFLPSGLKSKFNGASQIAVVTLGKTIITASGLLDPVHVAFGTRTLQAGGPALVIAGQIVSYGTDRIIRVGKSSSIYIGVTIKRTMQTSEIETTTKRPLQPLQQTDVAMFDTTHAVSTAVKGTETMGSMARSQILRGDSPTIGSSGVEVAHTSATGKGKKKSGARGQADRFSSFMLALGSAFGICLRLRLF